MKNKLTVVTLVASACLAGCGGGGGSSEPVAQPLAVYAGTWASACDDREQDSLAISLLSNGSLSAVSKTDYYQHVGCTGAIVATATVNGTFAFTHNGTADTSVVLLPGAAPTAIKVDKITLAAPKITTTVTGPAVTTNVVNGVTQHCFAYDTGSSCVSFEEGPAQTISGAVYTRNNELYILEPSGASYSVVDFYKKK